MNLLLLMNLDFAAGPAPPPIGGAGGRDPHRAIGTLSGVAHTNTHASCGGYSGWMTRLITHWRLQWVAL